MNPESRAFGRIWNITGHQFPNRVHLVEFGTSLINNIQISCTWPNLEHRWSTIFKFRAFGRIWNITGHQFPNRVHLVEFGTSPVNHRQPIIGSLSSAVLRVACLQCAV